MNAADRFWAKVDTSAGPEGCWPWTGARDPDGYGRFRASDGRTVLAHRESLALAGRPAAPGQAACHSCDNPPCVNPAHLSVAAQAENLADMDRKGRRRGAPPIGEQHHSARLTEDLVREIRARSAEGTNQPTLAAMYGVRQSSISKLLLGRTWRHVS